MLFADGEFFMEYMEPDRENEETFKDAIERAQPTKHTLINLHAMSGVISPKMIHMHGQMDGNWAIRLQCRRGSGDQLERKWVYCGVYLCVQGTRIGVDQYVLPLVGFNILLGVQW